MVSRLTPPLVPITRIVRRETNGWCSLLTIPEDDLAPDCVRNSACRDETRTNPTWLCALLRIYAGECWPTFQVFLVKPPLIEKRSTGNQTGEAID
jgi:hypothetical protein